MIRKLLLWGLGALLVFVVGVILYNVAWFESPHGDGKIRLISHRGGTRGIDSLDELKAVPRNFAGYVWTNRIELIGPELEKQGR